MAAKAHGYTNKQTLVLEDEDIIRGDRLTDETGLNLSEVNRTCLRFGIEHFSKKPLALVTYRVSLLKKRKAAKKK